MQPSFKMVVKLLFRVIDREGSVDSKAVFRDIMTKLKVPLLCLKSVTAGFNAILEREEDVDPLLSETGIQVLRSLNISARISPEVRAKRSLFLRRVDAYVGEHTAEELKIEFEAQNAWLKIREVFRMKDYNHVIKIECREVSMADKALENGIFCFYSKIAALQIEKET